MLELRTLACAGLALLAIAAPAQEPKPSAAPAPAFPKPGPEHALLKNDVGTWDATVEVFPAPGAPAQVSKGTETNVLGPGGLWLVSDFKSEFMGQPFTGHGTYGYDPVKKRYVGTWVDSMSSWISTSVASYDPATKVMTGVMDSRDPAGKPVKVKETTEWKADGRVFTMFDKGPDGKEYVSMRITYTRRK